MHRLADAVVASEREREVGDTARSQSSGEVGLDPSHGLDEVHPETGMFLNAGTDGEDVGVEHYVLRRYAGFCQKLVAAGADPDLAIKRNRLTLFVEGHHNHGSSERMDLPCLAEELLFPFLEGNGVDDAFARRILQSFEYGIPMGGINHHGGLGDVRLARDMAQEHLHLLRRIHHGIVHVDVDDAGPTLDLRGGDGQGFVVLTGRDEPGELARTGDVGALTDVGKVPAPVD